MRNPAIPAGREKVRHGGTLKSAERQLTHAHAVFPARYLPDKFSAVIDVDPLLKAHRGMGKDKPVNIEIPRDLDLIHRLIIPDPVKPRPVSPRRYPGRTVLRIVCAVHVLGPEIGHCLLFRGRTRSVGIVQNRLRVSGRGRLYRAHARDVAG